MPINNYEEWEQAICDQRIEVEKERIRHAAEARERGYHKVNPRKIPTLFDLHLRHGIKVAMIWTVLGLLLMFFLKNLPVWFAPLVDFLSTAFVDIMG